MFIISFSVSHRAAFAKESEVLTGNLGDKLIPQNEILRDVSDLKALANLQESMEWLATRLRGFFSTLPRSCSECVYCIRLAGGLRIEYVSTMYCVKTFSNLLFFLYRINDHANVLVII